LIFIRYKLFGNKLQIRIKNENKEIRFVLEALGLSHFYKEIFNIFNDNLVN